MALYVDLEAARLAGPGRRDRLAVGVEDRRLVRRIVVAGHQVHQSAPGPATELPRPAAPRCSRRSWPRARRRRPACAPGRTRRGPSSPPCGRSAGSRRSAVGLLLGDEGRFLLELGLGRPEEIATRLSVVPGGPERARRRCGCSGRRCCRGHLRTGGRSGGRRSRRRHAPGPTRPLGGGAGRRRGASPFRSENRALQVRRRSIRRDLSGPWRWGAVGVAGVAAFPLVGAAGIQAQQKRERSSMWMGPVVRSLRGTPSCVVPERYTTEVRVRAILLSHGVFLQSIEFMRWQHAHRRSYQKTAISDGSSTGKVPAQCNKKSEGFHIYQASYDLPGSNDRFSAWH